MARYLRDPDDNSSNVPTASSSKVLEDHPPCRFPKRQDFDAGLDQAEQEHQLRREACERSGLQRLSLCSQTTHDPWTPLLQDFTSVLHHILTLRRVEHLLLRCPGFYDSVRSAALSRSMPPIPHASSPTPRVVVYYQTHHGPGGVPVSVLPLVTRPDTRITHLILAALHLNDPCGNITLNDAAPSHPGNQTLWAELAVLRASGVKCMAMLGGAAKGSFARLDGDEATFAAHYAPLRDLVRDRAFDGLDLDVEEEMSLAGVIRLIDRLKADFGPDFIITLAPVAPALLSSEPKYNLSGFDYEALEVMRGGSIAWYNTQFYCGWGDMSSTMGYDMIIARGFPPRKIVAGMITSPANGAGWVPFEVLQEVLINLRLRYGAQFGGVMGWEYFNSLPGAELKPWQWASFMTENVLNGLASAGPKPKVTDLAQSETPLPDGSHVDEIETNDAQLPQAFEYYTDGSLDD